VHRAPPRRTEARRWRIELRPGHRREVWGRERRMAGDRRKGVRTSVVAAMSAGLPRSLNSSACISMPQAGAPLLPLSYAAHPPLSLVAAAVRPPPPPPSGRHGRTHDVGRLGLHGRGERGGLGGGEELNASSTVVPSSPELNVGCGG
jgi:hypothetical protein